MNRENPTKIDTPQLQVYWRKLSELVKKDGIPQAQDLESYKRRLFNFWEVRSSFKLDIRPIQRKFFLLRSPPSLNMSSPSLVKNKNNKNTISIITVSY